MNHTLGVDPRDATRISDVRRWPDQQPIQHVQHHHGGPESLLCIAALAPSPVTPGQIRRHRPNVEPGDRCLNVYTIAAVLPRGFAGIDFTAIDV